MISARGISASLAVHAVFAGWIVNAAPLPHDIVEDAEAARAIEVLLEIEPEAVTEPSLASQQQLAMVMERPSAEPVVEVTEAIDPPELELPPLAELPPVDLSDFEKPVEKAAEAPVAPVPEKVDEPRKPASRKVEDVKSRKAETARPKEQKPKRKIVKTAKPVAEKPVAAVKNSSSSKKAFAATAGRKALASGGKTVDPGYKSRILSKLRAAKRAPKASASGRVVLSFTVSRSGSLISARIAKSGGHPALDQATLAMARAAAPFPPMPAGMNRASMSFTVPVQYN
jgi:protein TonB